MNKSYMGTTATAVGVDDAREPELAVIITSLLEITARLEIHGGDLMSFEPKVCLNGVKPTPEVGPIGELSDNYGDRLRHIVGRLRAVDEEQLGPAVVMLRAFL
ncbi:hypothetical protein LCGC14_1105920 [marine sediment metagenome]|uniref:Uncharacterized protein n=1 Tax=marine sediment metagenome TaxID=412755 RepID=A0A0F9MCU1_9ZZZZ